MYYNTSIQYGVLTILSLLNNIIENGKNNKYGNVSITLNVIITLSILCLFII